MSTILSFLRAEFNNPGQHATFGQDPRSGQIKQQFNHNK